MMFRAAKTLELVQQASLRIVIHFVRPEHSNLNVLGQPVDMLSELPPLGARLLPCAELLGVDGRPASSEPMPPVV